MTSFSNDLATYQHLVYGNKQLLLQQRKTLSIIKKADDIDSVMEPEPHQQKIAYSPFFVDIIRQKDKDTVYGYIRQKCQVLLPFHLNSYYCIAIDIRKMVLYYYCFARYQYDGSIGDWSKEQLYGRYSPLKQIRCDDHKTIFEGISTWCNKSKNIKFNTKVNIIKVKHLSDNKYVDIRRSILVLRELKILRTLFGHQSVRSLYDILPPTDLNNFDSMTMVFEHIDTDLTTIFCTNQYFSALHVQYILYHILLGVKYIHDAGIIHKDLRPATILINADCTVKISSFTHSCGVDERRYRWYKAHRFYRAPEIILLHSSSHTRPGHLYAMDMWSIGCIFGELLQMEQVNCPDIHQRSPLFVGKSYLLSPKLYIKNGKVYESRHEQLREIFKVVGYPNECEMEWLTDHRAISCVNDLKDKSRSAFNSIARRKARDRYLGVHFVSGIGNDGVNLMENLLQFDIRKRYSAIDAIKSAYFNDVRDAELESISPPKMYEFQEIRKYDNTETLPIDEFKKLLIEEIANYT